MASTDDTLDAWHKVETALNSQFPGKEDSDKKINRLRNKLSDEDIELAHRLRQERNEMIHRRKPIRNPEAFVRDAERLAQLIAGKRSSSFRLPRPMKLAIIGLGCMFVFAELLAQNVPGAQAALAQVLDGFIVFAFFMGVLWFVITKILP